MSGSAHGHTTAAWTGVGVSFIGFILAAVAMVWGPSPVLVAVGLVIAALGAVVGKLMSAAGFGKKPGDKAHYTPSKKSPVGTGI
ncbi:HGxxPAAW family protein [Streptacidiphilus albus]|uniref:HGxxPAAW family protein n=1 Tax=Streptacidiphilus albus TaxID=105425 RepID=UPI0005A72704|nr:HGxxPAAW family protein [Streptacidiphilus albus]